MSALNQKALEAAHWALDGSLCDFDEDTGRFEPIQGDEETALGRAITTYLAVVAKQGTGQ